MWKFYLNSYIINYLLIHAFTHVNACTEPPLEINFIHIIRQQGIFSNVAIIPSGSEPPHYRVFTTTLRHTTFRRTFLDELSVQRTDLYLTKLNTHKGQKFMSPARFEPTIVANERSQTHALDRAATAISNKKIYCTFKTWCILADLFSKKCRLFHNFIFFYPTNIRALPNHALKCIHPPQCDRDK
jgi:hypothetical protein